MDLSPPPHTSCGQACVKGVLSFALVVVLFALTVLAFLFFAMSIVSMLDAHHKASYGYGSGYRVGTYSPSGYSPLYASTMDMASMRGYEHGANLTDTDAALLIIRIYDAMRSGNNLLDMVAIDSAAATNDGAILQDITSVRESHAS